MIDVLVRVTKRNLLDRIARQLDLWASVARTRAEFYGPGRNSQADIDGLIQSMRDNRPGGAERAS